MSKARIPREQFDPSTWRVIVTPPLDGAQNMAIDAAIGEAVAAKQVRPTLRFYAWSPACVSLGRTQSAEMVDPARCADLGWDIVRRTTGGRAVLHVDELTYSIAAPLDEPRVKGGVLESYRRLSLGLLRGLKQAGLDSQRAQATYPDLGDKGAACFDAPSDYEITIGQRKLIGSAQMRSRGLVLQHGSIPLSGDITRLVDGLSLRSGERMALRNRLRFRATTVTYALGKAVDSAELTTHLTNGFAQALNLQFESGELTATEQNRAAEIRATQFASDSWTYKL